MPDRHLLLKLFLLFLIAFSIRFYLGWHYYDISPDGVYYAQIGEHIYQNHSYGIINVPGYPAIIQPPVYPSLIAFSRIMIPKEFAGKFVNIVLGTFLVILIFFIAKSLYGQKVANLSAFIAAIHPFLIFFSIQWLTETTFLFWAAVSLLSIRQFQLQRKWYFAIGAVIAAGLAYLTRVEGILILGLVWALVVYHAIPKRNFHLIAGTSILVAAIIIGYAGWVSAKVDRWVWIPKLYFTQSHKIIFQLKAQSNPQFLEENPRLRTRKVFAAIDSTNSQLLSFHLFHLLIKGVHLEIPQSSPINRKQVFKNMMAYNFRSLLWVIYRRYAIPVSLIPFLLIGFLYGFYKKKKFKEHLFVLLWFFPFGYFLLSHVEKRFLLGWAFLSVLWIALGIAVLYHWLRKRFPFQKILMGGMYGGIIIVLFPFFLQLVEKIDTENQLYKVTHQLREVIPQGAKVVSSRPIHAFYNDWVFYRLPWIDNPQQLYEYLKHTSSEYLLLEAPRDTLYNQHYALLFQKGLPSQYVQKNAIIEIPDFTTRWFQLNRTKNAVP